MSDDSLTEVADAIIPPNEGPDCKVAAPNNLHLEQVTAEAVSGYVGAFYDKEASVGDILKDITRLLGMSQDGPSLRIPTVTEDPRTQTIRLAHNCTQAMIVIEHLAVLKEMATRAAQACARAMMFNPQLPDEALTVENLRKRVDGSEVAEERWAVVGPAWNLKTEPPTRYETRVISLHETEIEAQRALVGLRRVHAAQCELDFGGFITRVDTHCRVGSRDEKAKFGDRVF